MYNYDIEESEEDIYFNSFIGFVDKEYKDENEKIYSYLLDRRFIIDKEKLINYLNRNYIITIDDHDDYFIIIKINNKEEFIDTRLLFGELQNQDLIFSTNEFIKAYNVKPRYRKSNPKYNIFRDQL